MKKTLHCIVDANKRLSYFISGILNALFPPPLTFLDGILHSSHSDICTFADVTSINKCFASADVFLSY